METGAERGRDEGNREETIREGELAPKSGKRTPAVMRAPSTGGWRPGELTASLTHPSRAEVSPPPPSGGHHTTLKGRTG